MQGMMGQRIAMAIIRVMNSIMAGSSTAKVSREEDELKGLDSMQKYHHIPFVEIRWLYYLYNRNSFSVRMFPSHCK